MVYNKRLMVTIKVPVVITTLWTAVVGQTTAIMVLISTAAWKTTRHHDDHLTSSQGALAEVVNSCFYLWFDLWFDSLYTALIFWSLVLWAGQTWFHSPVPDWGWCCFVDGGHIWSLSSFGRSGTFLGQRRNGAIRLSPPWGLAGHGSFPRRDVFPLSGWSDSVGAPK